MKIWGRFIIAAALTSGAVAAPVWAAAQSASVDPQTKAMLLGAAFANSDVSSSAGGGMMFLPGRGLIRWETRGKTLAEQEELKTEAIGLADARAVQAQIDAQHEALAAERQRADEVQFERDHAHLMADASSVRGLNVAPITGTKRQAGAVVPLNRAAKDQLAGALGLRDGAGFKNRNRVYLFGAVSGRGVGLNLLHDTGPGWKNAGLSTDKGGFVGQRQAGIAIRKGSTQAALSYVREKTHAHILGITDIKDHRAMLNISITPSVGP